MTSQSFVQRNNYKGKSPRAWVVIRFVASDGTLHERELVADSGSPCAVILSESDHKLLLHAGASGINSNFGFLAGGWVEVQMPELGLTQPIRGFGNDAVIQAVQRDWPDFSGIIGLPFLRLIEYGGDKDCFWLRHPSPGAGASGSQTT